jgi:pilus assembly protein Flp/PilA
MRLRRRVARNAARAQDFKKTKGEDMRTLQRLWKEEEGQDLIEYALLVALIALVAMAAFPALGNSIQAVFTRANTCLNSSTGC